MPKYRDKPVQSLNIFEAEEEVLSLDSEISIHDKLYYQKKNKQSRQVPVFASLHS